MFLKPIKCEVIRICKRRSQITDSYTIHGHQLAIVKSGKYIGVTRTYNLSWNVHVDQATKKANNSLAFMRRNLYSCTSHTKVQSYQTLVRPILEYVSSAGDPNTRITSTSWKLSSAALQDLSLGITALLVKYLILCPSGMGNPAAKTHTGKAGDDGHALPITIYYRTGQHLPVLLFHPSL